jgi:hypothetical protein
LCYSGSLIDNEHEEKLMEIYNFTTDTLTGVLNDGKDTLADATGLKELNNWVLVAAKPSIFGRLRSLFGGEGDKMTLMAFRVSNGEKK